MENQTLTQVEISAPPSTVLVTGATGYIAAVLLQRLLAAGHTVHGTVRDVAKATADLQVLPGAPERLKLFKADLLSPDGFKEAMQGVSVVFHTASPVVMGAIHGEEAQKRLVDPALQGTINVLNAVNETPSVRRVVLTSSMAAIVHSTHARPPNHVFTEEDWNEQSTLYEQPYHLSKVLAEKKAWEIARQQKRWDLVVINPVVVWGPPAIARSANSDSLGFLTKAILKNKFAFICPSVAAGIVDVRDVAAAHALAAFTPSASGRYIVAPRTLTMRQAVLLASQLFPGKVRPPFLQLPKWLALLLGPYIGVGRDVVKARFDTFPRYSSEKVKKELGLQFLPVEDTLKDAVDRLRQLGLSPI